MFEHLVLLCGVFLMALLLGYVFWARLNYGILDNSGFPVVPPTLFRGSSPNSRTDLQHDLDIDRFRKYGGIWGAYEGRTPAVFVCDPDLLRRIFVTDHQHFYDRRHVDLGTPVMNQLLNFSQGAKWRSVRSALSPFFTGSKVKRVMGIVEAHIRDYVKELKSGCDENGRIKYECQKRNSFWFVDLFARSMLQIQLTNENGSINEFAAAFGNMVGDNIDKGWVHTMSMFLPLFSYFTNKSTQVVETTLRSIISNRSTNPKVEDRIFVDGLRELWDGIERPESRLLGLNREAVIGAAVDFFLGGSDASATCSSALLYYLASDPAAQDRLHAEVCRGTEESLRDEAWPFLTACINEALRLVPPIPRPERICTKDWAAGGIRIRRGTQVFLAPWAGHRDPKYFPDPDRFVPDRFLPQNRGTIPTYAFIPFGHGHRNCPGIRFAYDSIKVFFIHVIRAFRVEMRGDTVLKFTRGPSLATTFDPIYLDLVRRDLG